MSAVDRAAPSRADREALSVSCNRCGAALPIPAASEVTFCVHCGNRVFIEPNLRKHHDHALAAISVEHEALRALETALQAECRVRARNQVGLVGAVFGAPAAICGLIVHFGSAYLQAWLVLALHGLILASALVAALAAGVAAVMLMARRTVAAKAGADLARFTRALETRPLSSKCPNCGAPIEASAVTTTFHCAHCRIELLIARGVAIRWSNDARTRGDQWKREAERALDYANFEPANRHVLWYALLFIAASGFNALGAVYDWLLG